MKKTLKQVLAAVMVTAAGATAAAATPPDIVDRLERTGKFNILLTALQTANLKDTLKTEGPFTLFAPTDQAFVALLSDLDIEADQLLASPDLSKILLYHVLGGAQDAGDLLGTSTQTTLSDSQPLLVVLEGARVKVNGSTVIRANVRTGNGIIHVIDQVLLPPGEPMAIESLVDVLALDGRFTVLLAALEKTGLDDALAMDGPFTLFAPTDDAFTALLKRMGVTADQLLDDAGLTDILLYHVAAGEKNARSLLRRGGTETLLEGQRVRVRLKRSGVFVNDARIRNLNVKAPNGVIHTLDAVLLP